MNDIDRKISLWNKYGSYTKDGYWISDHEKYDYYMNNPKEANRIKTKAALMMLIPFLGFIAAALHYEELGISIV